MSAKKIVIDEYKQLLSKLSMYSDEESSTLLEIKSAINELVDSKGFTGVGADEIKNYYNEVHCTIAETIPTVLSETEYLLENLLKDFSLTIDEDSEACLHEAYLYDLKDQLERHIHDYDQIDEEVRVPLSDIQDILETPFPDVRELQESNAVALNNVNETIEALNDFDNRHLHDFDEVMLVIERLRETINQYRKSGAESSSIHYTQGSFMSSMNGVALSSYQLSTEQQFVNQLTGQFGFGKEEARLMIKLWDALKKKNPDYSQTDLAFQYTRVLGGFVYDGLEWNATAGIPYANLSEKRFFTKKLGFTEEEYRLLRYKVRIQNQIASNPDEYAHLLEHTDTEDYIAAKSAMEEALNRKLSDEEFKSLWKEQYVSMKDKGDFAHQSITTATQLYNGHTPSANVVTDGMTEESAGWFGDATIKYPSGETSFGADDYRADLDAVNIEKIMIDNDLSYQEAFNDYYLGLETGKYNRADMFLQSHNYEEVEDSILSELNVDAVEDLKIDYPDTYNFLMSLKNGENEMGKYK